MSDRACWSYQTFVEAGPDWAKSVGPLRKLKHRGVPLVGWVVPFTLAVYNLARLRTLVRTGACPA